MTDKRDDSTRDTPKPQPDLASRLRAHPRFVKRKDSGRGTVIVGAREVKQEEPK